MHGFSPSNAFRWMNCPQSVGGSPRVVEDQDEARLEGIAAHWVAQELFHRRPVAIGQSSPNLVKVTDEMQEAAILYVKSLDPTSVIEQCLKLDVISKGMVGYPDAYSYIAGGTILKISDFKFGHRYVDEFENWQLLVEAAGLITPEVKTLVLEVVQPRCYFAEPVRNWVLPVEEYQRHYLPRIKDAAARVVDGTLNAEAGSWCFGCQHSHTCAALANRAYNSVDNARGYTHALLDVKSLSRELSVLYDAQEAITARLTGLEEQAMAELKNGKAIPGYYLEHRKGHSKWTVEIPTVIELGKLEGVELAKPATCITPNQAIESGMNKDVVKLLSERPNIGTKLTRDNGKQARKAFKQ
jgi:hypothetical protein